MAESTLEGGDAFDGVWAVELAQSVFVPVAGALLADWGADVIRVDLLEGDPYHGLATQGIGTDGGAVNVSIAPLVVASVGGSPRHPAWYLNLQADSHASVQVRGDHFDVVARTASPDEKPRLWQIVNDVWPNYDVYQSRTDRDIPVVVLTPVGNGSAGE